MYLDTGSNPIWLKPEEANEIGFNVHIQSKLLKRTIVVGASFDLGQPFRSRQLKKGVGVGWDENRLSRCDIRAEEQGRKEMFYLTTHSTHFIYGYMASDIW